MKELVLLNSDVGLLVILLIYAAFCSIVGFMALDRKIGFWGAFGISFLTSPLIGFIIMLASPMKNAKPKGSQTCKHCQLQSPTSFYYCPRCLKDVDGFTQEQNKERFKS
jgi:hypothetical protein